MKHTASLALFEYWNERRAGRPAPLRHDITPADIRAYLPGILILERSPEEELAFRLAGTGICGMFGRELKGARLGDLWLPTHSEPALRTAASVIEQARPAVFELIAESRAGRAVTLELLLLPIATTAASIDRILGVLTPAKRPYWMDLDPIVGCVTHSARLLDPAMDGARPELSEQAGPGFRNRPGPQRVHPLERAHHRTILEGGGRD